MSYKERSIWISLCITLYIGFNYFSEIYWKVQDNSLTLESMRSALLVVVLMTIFLEILLHIIIAIIDSKNANTDADERDQQISLLGINNAYYILCFTIATATFHLLFPVMRQHVVDSFSLPNEYLIINIVIFGTLIAEITKFSTQVFYYRRGF